MNVVYAAIDVCRDKDYNKLYRESKKQKNLAKIKCIFILPRKITPDWFYALQVIKKFNDGSFYARLAFMSSSIDNLSDIDKNDNSLVYMYTKSNKLINEEFKKLKVGEFLKVFTLLPVGTVTINAGTANQREIYAMSVLNWKIGKEK
jgi:hypothetical protein